MTRTTLSFRVLGTNRSILRLTAALAWQVAACSSSLPSTGTGSGSCADCAQEYACCQAIQAAAHTMYQCPTTESVCASLDDIDEQRSYIETCDGYLYDQAHTDGAPAVCK
jgi:hypothetical protein